MCTSAAARLQKSRSSNVYTPALDRTDDIADWTGMKINEVATAAEDRDHWRGILRAANPSYGRHALNDDYESCRLRGLYPSFRWRNGVRGTMDWIVVCAK